MSGIVLSASVRQNLLSLQSTAALLATTQNDLATGKKVNSALDNPTNYLHGAGPQQPRQRHQQPARRHRQRRAGAAGGQHRPHLAAELVDTAKSIANQVLQSPVGYTTKSNVTSAAITGATAQQPARHAATNDHRHRHRDPQQPGHAGCDHGRHQAGLRGDLGHAGTATPRTAQLHRRRQDHHL